MKNNYNQFSITINCEDNIGLIYELTSVLKKHQSNIIKLEEHVEQLQFFCRIEWETIKDFKKEEWENEFQIIKQKNYGTFKLQNSKEKSKLVLFCSDDCHCILDILNRIKLGFYNTELQCIITNSEKANDLLKNSEFKIYYKPVLGTRTDHENEIIELLNNIDYDLIGLARYMRILSKSFLVKIKQPIINVHHSFLPSFKGGDAYEQAYQRGVKCIGATAHYVTEELDEGPIIAQSIQEVSHLESIDQLKIVGQKCEQDVFARAIKKQLTNKIIFFGNRTIIFN